MTASKVCMCFSGQLEQQFKPFGPVINPTPKAIGDKPARAYYHRNSEPPCVNRNQYALGSCAGVTPPLPARSLNSATCFLSYKLLPTNDSQAKPDQWKTGRIEWFVATSQLWRCCVVRAKG